ncbi:hypothetical protein ACQ9LF_10075 [Anaerohalosphaeraceae bacterium U12dextr]
MGRKTFTFTQEKFIFSQMTKRPKNIRPDNTFAALKFRKESTQIQDVICLDMGAFVVENPAE